MNNKFSTLVDMDVHARSITCSATIANPASDHTIVDVPGVKPTINLTT